jgi:hypothetical protein
MFAPRRAYSCSAHRFDGQGHETAPNASTVSATIREFYMPRFLLAALFSGATCLGLITTAQATTKLSATTAAPARAPAVLSVDAHCGPHHHWVPRYRHHDHWYGGYCARNH